MLINKENKVYVVRIGKIFSLQALDQIFYLIFLDNNNDISKVKIGKISCYLGI